MYPWQSLVIMDNIQFRDLLHAQIVPRDINAQIKLKLLLKNAYLEHILQESKVYAKNVQQDMVATRFLNTHVIKVKFLFLEMVCADI